VYDFPSKSPLHRSLTRFVLRRAACVLSTSNAMKTEIAKYTDKEIHVTPFGVDMALFSPDRRTRAGADGRYVGGTVKALEEIYGIEYLLDACALVARRRPDIPLEVRIAGKGSRADALRARAWELGIGERVRWLGFLPQEEVAVEWANMDVAVIPSVLDSESFGISAVEAQACGLPVIVSDVPGLMEAASPGVSGIVVPRRDAEKIAQRLIEWYDDPAAAARYGQNGREYVRERYELEACFRTVERLYQSKLTGEREAAGRERNETGNDGHKRGDPGL
jgi:glycosyltransferase involved in cell wall biosynthesis